MHRVEKALETFRNPYTCAQTVAAAFGHTDNLDAMKVCSGGRAPGGECGALYAARQCCPAASHAALEAAFVAKTGAKTCREIKRDHKTPCETCVRAASEFLAGVLK